MARIAVLAPDLGGNAVYTPWMFSGALSLRHQVRLIGPESGGLWPPAVGEVEVEGILPGANPVRRAVRFFNACRQFLAGRPDAFAPLSRNPTRRRMNWRPSLRQLLR